jgi:uroporphyrinogen-III synthase
MEADTVTTMSLAGRTVLVSPDNACAELKTELERYGARVLTWPKIDVRALDNCDAIDETIGNLFGYDWLIFRNAHAVDFFLRRFRELGHEIGELDALRVCGVGEAAVSRLESAQVHVDVIPGRLSSELVCGAIETYAGSPNALRGLNLLIPGAGTSHDYLAEALHDAGARVDLMTTYRTCSANDPPMTRISTLLAGGGIDCVAFTTSSQVREFAALFDTSDLGRFLAGVAVACFAENTAHEAVSFGLTADVIPLESSLAALAQVIAANCPG